MAAANLPGRRIETIKEIVTPTQTIATNTVGTILADGTQVVHNQMAGQSTTSDPSAVILSFSVSGKLFNIPIAQDQLQYFIKDVPVGTPISDL